GAPWTSSASRPSPLSSTPTPPATPPQPRRRHRVDGAEPRHHAPQPQIHRVHGLRAAPHPQRAPYPRPPGPVGVVPGPGASGHHRPADLGRRPAGRGRARLGAGRGGPAHPSRDRAVLPVPGPGPLPGLPAADGREQLQRRLPDRLLPVPAQLGQPQARRRSPRPSPHRPGPRTAAGPGRRRFLRPLGVRLEPLGKTGVDEARAAFAEQIQALVTAGVNFLVIETMPALNEAHEALSAAHAIAPDLPVLVMVTVDDESNCLDGASPEQAAALLTEWGAGAIGVNCSTGPATVLTAIEAMRKATTLPIAAMPNAGMPRAVEGRNIYLCSPEYMASFARKAIAAGAQIVGGCCGTTPNHIRAMRSAMRAIDAQARVVTSGASPVLNTETPPAPLGDRSRIGSLIEQGKFITLVEIVPPRGINCVKEIEGSQLLAQLGGNCINCP